MMVGFASVSGTTARAQEPKAQQNMIKEIRHQLVLLPYYSVFDNLSFRMEGSKVILLGQVVRPTLEVGRRSRGEERRGRFERAE